MKEKLTIQHGTIQETLLIPLFARAEETARKKRIITDQASVELIHRIDYNFEKFRKDWITLLSTIVRTRIFDEIIAQFLQKNIDGIILNLGCGLCTRYSRMNNGQLLWVDLDLPEVIGFKRQLVAETPNYHLIAKSLFDETWIDDVFKWFSSYHTQNRKIMIVAEGLLYYFDPEKVTSLMNLLVKHFHGADLLIEVANTKMVATCHRYSALKEMGLTFQWGIDDFAAIEKISPKLHFIQEYYLYNRFRYRWKYYAALHFIPWMKKSLRIIHLNIT